MRVHSFAEETADVDLTPAQRRVAAYLVHTPLSVNDIRMLVGGYIRDKPELAVVFMKNLRKRLDGSWWQVENDFGKWSVTRRPTREV